MTEGAARASELGALPEEVVRRIAALAERYGLGSPAVGRLCLLVELLAHDPYAPTAIRDARLIVDHHLADSLVGLEVEPVRKARVAIDIGSGAGLPGLPLAIALPHASFVLLESAARKCAFLERAAGACAIANVRVVHDRAESYTEGFGRFDLAVVRAVASLEVTAEYAAPLLRLGGKMVAWAGKRAPETEEVACRAADELGLERAEVRRVEPFPEADNRHLYLMSKVRGTPSRFPRRPGVAAKRPLGRVVRERTSSDRSPR